MRDLPRVVSLKPHSKAQNQWIKETFQLRSRAYALKAKIEELLAKQEQQTSPKASHKTGKTPETPSSSSTTTELPVVKPILLGKIKLPQGTSEPSNPVKPCILDTVQFQRLHMIFVN
jgi:hypothetical protein